MNFEYKFASFLVKVHFGASEEKIPIYIYIYFAKQIIFHILLIFLVFLMAFYKVFYYLKNIKKISFVFRRGFIPPLYFVKVIIVASIVYSTRNPLFFLPTLIDDTLNPCAFSSHHHLVIATDHLLAPSSLVSLHLAPTTTTTSSGSLRSFPASLQASDT